MTHEQKPEIAEFRTREEQVRDMATSMRDMANSLSEWLGVPMSVHVEYSEEQVAEAEARGAAEQRRKDAEGVEPTCYTAQEELDRIRDGKSADIYPSSRLQWVKEDYWPIPLHTRPANVAALEARVKELKQALVEIVNIKTRDAPYLTDSRYHDRVMWALVECRRKARAAIREGEQP